MLCAGTTHCEEGSDEQPLPPLPRQQSRQILTCPGEFKNLDHDKSLEVQPSSGLALGFIKMLHRHTPLSEADTADASTIVREPAVLQAMMQIQGPGDSKKLMVVLEDKAASPTLSVVLQPHPEHWVISQIASSVRPWRGGSVEATAAVDGSAAKLMSLELEAKHAGPDFHAIASVSSGQEMQGSLTYHQAVTPLVTLGGTVTADLARILPVPDPRALTWQAFGSYHDPKGQTYGLAGFDAGRAALTLRAWHQAHESLILGADFRLMAAQDWPSVAGVGAKYTLGGEGGGPMHAPVTLAVHVDTDRKAAVSVSTSNSPMSQMIGNTAQFTTVTGTFNHPKQEYAIGVNLQFQG